MIQEIFLYYLLAINLLTFIAYGHDKWKSKHPRVKTSRHSRSDSSRAHGNSRRRTPEATLLLLAALGGSIGALAAMYLFRHKTLHRKFTIGVPMILAAQVALAVFVLF